MFSQTFTPGNNVYHKRSEASLQLASLGSNIYRNGVSIPSAQRMIEVDDTLYLVEAVGHGRKLGIEQSLSGGEHFEVVLRTVQHQQLGTAHGRFKRGYLLLVEFQPLAVAGR